MCYNDVPGFPEAGPAEQSRGVTLEHEGGSRGEVERETLDRIRSSGEPGVRSGHWTETVGREPSSMSAQWSGHKSRGPSAWSPGHMTPGDNDNDPEAILQR